MNLLRYFLHEDARNRTNRATETTKFLEQEVKKLQTELASIDDKLIRSREQSPEPYPDWVSSSGVRSQVCGVFAVPSRGARLKALIEALEKEGGQWVQASPAPVGGYNQPLDPLVLQRMSVQTNLSRLLRNLQRHVGAKALNETSSPSVWKFLNRPFPHKGLIKPNRPKLLAIGVICRCCSWFCRDICG